ncbi:hypothetical protein CALCODRAFT_511315 [Calocera cornea HHB12733]|uniref:Uncharacterized protein n=1 Tax=Calocera cornea HHB12733 TaxID=1353952 RepID=A0A165DV63_9BASI|nr:hypothetical protein CALCODRAFT_511315 [Calocera cornea HHB12733]
MAKSKRTKISSGVTNTTTSLQLAVNADPPVTSDDQNALAVAVVVSGSTDEPQGVVDSNASSEYSTGGQPESTSPPPCPNGSENSHSTDNLASSVSVQQHLDTHFLPSPSVHGTQRLNDLLAWIREEGYNLADSADLNDLSWGEVIKGEGVCLHDGEQPAHLTLVAKIGEDGFNLTTHGGWRRDNSFGRGLDKQKATAFLVKPDRSPFNTLFERAISNITALQARGMHEGSDILSVLKDGAIKISWPLYEKIPSDESLDWTTASTDDGWTLTSSSRCHALMLATADTASSRNEWNDWPTPPHLISDIGVLKTTHHPLPLPAYRSNGERISPSYWRSELQGAIVKVKLLFKFYYIGNDKRSVFVLQPYDVVVVYPPVVQSSSPIKKRKLDDGPSPSSRRRPVRA